MENKNEMAKNWVQEQQNKDTGFWRKDVQAIDNTDDEYILEAIQNGYLFEEAKKIFDLDESEQEQLVDDLYEMLG